jgi:methyl-accepting chemotaxis protein
VRANPWARFGSQRTLWITLAVALGLLLLTVEITAALGWAHGRVSAADLSSFRRYLIGVAAGTEAVAIAVVWWATTSITRPLRTAVGVLDRLAAGDLTVRLKIQNRDEVGLLAAALNTTTAALADEFRSVGADAASLAESAHRIGEISTGMAANASDTSQQATTVAGAAASVRGSTQVAADGVAGMNAAIREIAVSVTEAARVADQAVSAAATANATVSRLGDSSAEISNVVRVITGVAEQTNLLALNATIEAARAGESGKGFAVVASEVKDLAQETARATDDISTRVRAIQADTSGAIEAIVHIGTIIAEISRHQTAIAAAVEQQTAAAGGINASVLDSAARATEISDGIANVSRSAVHTSDTVHSVRSAADALDEMAQRLAALASRYHAEPV